jgi:hypothetical protein
MIDLPSLPTDNLYKFIALCGLVLFIASVTIPNILATRFRDQVDDLTIEAAPLEEEIKILHEQIARFENASPPDAERVSATRAASDQIRIKAAVVRAKLSVAHNRQKDLRLLLWVVVIGGILSSVIMWSGFRLWYYRLQQYQDAAVMTQIPAAVGSRE